MYDFNINKYWTWLCGNWKRVLASKSQDFKRHSWSFRWIWVALSHREIVTGSSKKGHSVVCTSMSNKAATPWAPRPGVYGTTRKWPFSPQAAFTFCHHVTPDLARIDCSATCVPGLFVKQSYCTRLPLVVAVISATRPRVLLLDVGKVSEVMEYVVLSIPVTLRSWVVAEKRGNG